MKIYILNKVLEYENNEESIDNILEELEDIISNSKYSFSHLEVDGENIYEDFHNYFTNNIKSIEKVKVVTKTAKDIGKEMIESVLEYLNEAIVDVEVLSYKIYNDQSKETFEDLIDILEGIKWMIDAFEVVDSNDELVHIVNSYETWNLYAKDIYLLKDIVEEVKETFIKDELECIPEILHDEIVPLFKDMKDKLDVLVIRRIDKSKLN